MATGTFTLTGGGTPTADARHHAIASTAVSMGQLQLGIDAMGPQPVTLSGGGRLYTGAPALIATFLLSGGGALTATYTPSKSGTLTLTGGGALTATNQPPALTGTFTLADGGSLTATATPGMTGTLTLPGGGALTAAAGAGRGGTFLLTGGGDLFATNDPPALTGTFTLSGGGTPTLTPTPGRSGTLTLTGGGDLAATNQPPAPTGTFALSGGGTLTALGVVNPTGLLVQVTEVLIEAQAFSIGVAPPPAPADLVITLLDSALDFAPGAVVAFVGNGTPEGTCVFSIGGLDVMTTSFDESGGVSGVSVPVHVSSTGSYQLVATDTTASLTASAPFTVAAITTAVTIGVQVTTPPTNVQQGTGVKKWVFQDPATTDVHHFAINPSKMNSPFAPKRITFTATTAIDGQALAFEGMTNPVEWQWEGVIFAKSEYDAFNTWMAKRNRIWVTDHFGRAWLTYLTNFQPVPRRDAQRNWCHDYTMTALIFEGPVTPT